MYSLARDRKRQKVTKRRQQQRCNCHHQAWCFKSAITIKQGSRPLAASPSGQASCNDSHRRRCGDCHDRTEIQRSWLKELTALHLLPLGFLSYTYYTAPQVQNSLFARVVVSAILPSNWESSLMGVHRIQVNNQ